MGNGTRAIVERGKNTRFTGENAAEMGRRGNAVRQANAPIRHMLKNICSDALHGHPPMSHDTLQKVAKFFKIPVREVEFGHVAAFKIITDAAKGDQGAFNLIAAYAGEKPAEKVEVVAPDYADLEAAFAAEQPDIPAPVPESAPDEAGDAP